MKREVMAQIFAGALLLSGCLPGDTRPTPGRVYVTAEGSAATTSGFSTADGWDVHFERLLAGIGNVSLDGESCNDYANAGYRRLFDFTVPGAAKLGEAYGLGACDIVLNLAPPSQDALLGKGVSASDLEFMRKLPDGLPPLDPNLPFEPSSLRTGVYMRGFAARGGVTKRFEWKFTGRFKLGDCASGPEEKPTSAVNLSGGDDKRPAITFHGEDLFLADADALRFNLFEAADANSDGDITLEELSSAPAPDDEEDAGVEDADAGVADGGLSDLSGLALFLSRQRVPRMVHLDQGPCRVVVDRPGR